MSVNLLTNTEEVQSKPRNLAKINEEAKEKGMCHIKMVSAEGHTDFILTPTEAAEEVRRFCREESKWLYIDKQFTSPDEVTSKMMRDAEDILLTNQVRGGFWGDNDDLWYDYDDEDEELEVDFEFDTGIPNGGADISVRIVGDEDFISVEGLINENKLIALLSRRSDILTAVEDELSLMAFKEARKVEGALARLVDFIDEDMFMAEVASEANYTLSSPNTLSVIFDANQNNIKVEVLHKDRFKILLRREVILDRIWEYLEELVQHEVHTMRIATGFAACDDDE